MHAAKIHYNTSLSNVDWLHGSAESMLTVTNLLIGKMAMWPASQHAIEIMLSQ